MCICKECVFCFFGVKGSVYISLVHLVSGVIQCHNILLILCLEDLATVDSGVLKSPMMAVLLSISFLKSSKIFFIYLGAPMLGAYVYKGYILLLAYSLKYYVMTFSDSFFDLCFEFYFV